MKNLSLSAVSPVAMRKIVIMALAMIGALPITTITAGASGKQAQNQRAQTPAQSHQNVQLNPGGGTGSTCTSTDGQSTCVCGEKCQATASSCSCFGVLPGKNKKPAKPLPLDAPGGGAQKATCTSGNGKKVCACGNAGCSASSENCSCVTAK